MTPSPVDRTREHLEVLADALTLPSEVGRYDVRGFPPDVPERACEVLMDDGTWEPGVVKQDTTTCHGHAALITWEGITAWLYRERGSGYPNEWRYSLRQAA